MTTLLGSRILIVEDEYLIAAEISRHLAEGGATVLGPMSSVRGTLDLLDLFDPPNAAILDIKLKGEMVYSVVDALLEHGIPMLFLTGYSKSEIPRRYAHVPLIEKPALPAQVVEDILRILHGNSIQVPGCDRERT